MATWFLEPYKRKQLTEYCIQELAIFKKGVDLFANAQGANTTFATLAKLVKERDSLLTKQNVTVVEKELEKLCHIILM
jgi:hypothetical protein